MSQMAVSLDISEPRSANMGIDTDFEKKKEEEEKDMCRCVPHKAHERFLVPDPPVAPGVPAPVNMDLRN